MTLAAIIKALGETLGNVVLRSAALDGCDGLRWRESDHT